MKSIVSKFSLLCIMMFFAYTGARAQNSPDAKKEPVMKTYLIERDIPGAGSLTPAELKGISQKSCTVIKEIGPQIVWLQSYVAGNKIYCVYKAENEELLRTHAKKGGFPITTITEINTTISPATAEK
jgi:Protein of unknown function (DUF4242)